MTDTKIPCTLIPGDGIGPGITEATVKVLEAAGAPFEWDRQLAGMSALASFVGLAGPEPMAVSGATVSTVHVREAMASFCARSVALTVKVCSPFGTSV